MQVNRELWLFGFDVTLIDLRNGSAVADRVFAAVSGSSEDAAKDCIVSEYARIGYCVQRADPIDKVKITLDLPALFQRGRQAKETAPERRPTPEKEG